MIPIFFIDDVLELIMNIGKIGYFYFVPVHALKDQTYNPVYAPPCWGHPPRVFGERGGGLHDVFVGYCAILKSCLMVGMLTHSMSWLRSILTG